MERNEHAPRSDNAYKINRRRPNIHLFYSIYDMWVGVIHTSHTHTWDVGPWTSTMPSQHRMHLIDSISISKDIRSNAKWKKQSSSIFAFIPCGGAPAPACPPDPIILLLLCFRRRRTHTYDSLHIHSNPNIRIVYESINYLWTTDIVNCVINWKVLVLLLPLLHRSVLGNSARTKCNNSSDFTTCDENEAI